MKSRSSHILLILKYEGVINLFYDLYKNITSDRRLYSYYEKYFELEFAEVMKDPLQRV